MIPMFVASTDLPNSPVGPSFPSSIPTICFNKWQWVMRKSQFGMGKSHFLMVESHVWCLKAYSIWLVGHLFVWLAGWLVWLVGCVCYIYIPNLAGLIYIRQPLPSPRRGGAWDHPRGGTCCLQTTTTLRGSFDQALHSNLSLGRSSLLFASLQTPKMLRGSFDQALWPQCFVVRAFKPAVCLHSHLLLGRSSLPLASLSNP